jgi:hypothetical protein
VKFALPRIFTANFVRRAREQQQEERKHLLDLVATYERAANAIAPLAREYFTRNGS